MSHIDDKDIKKLIKENVSKREIKLNSAQILARYYADKQELKAKPRRLSPLKLKIGLSFLSAFLVIGSFLYLSKALSLFPPLTSESSDVISTSDNEYSNIVADGKEGEFIFMVTSALLYAPRESSGQEIEPKIKYYSALSSLDKTNIEATLDITLPLIEEFYKARKGYQFQNQRGGAYFGKHGTYANEYIIDDSIRIVVNTTVEDDTSEGETEIFGEIISGGANYRIRGEKQGGKQKGEMNFALIVEYNDNTYLQISSQNNRDAQTFTYKLVVDDAEVMFIEITSPRRGPNHYKLVNVIVVDKSVTYSFKIEYRTERFFIEYDEYVIMAIKNEDNRYEYFYETPNSQ